MEIFTQAGGEMLSRWGHYLAGVTWIGLLYYFNFVQVPSFAQFEAAPRNEAISKLVPRALWWFRWGAVATVASGILILWAQDQLTDGDYWSSEPGIGISTGILLALIMFLNVWGVIWRKQKVVIANAEATAAGGAADPNAATAGRAALLASRTNTMFSIPMLFFMGATSHFAAFLNPLEGGQRALYWLITVIIVAIIELNGLGLIAGTEPGPTKKYLETHQNTIIAGFVLAAFFIILWEILF